MGFWQDLTGESGADAARRASEDQYSKQQAAIAKLLGYGDDYARMMRDLSGMFDPYAKTGAAANNSLMQLLQDPSSIRGTPGYQFNMEQGGQAIDRSAASRGMLNSGRQTKDTLRFSQGLADQTYGNQLQRLMGVSQMGLGATGAQVGTIGQGLSGQLGARTTAYQGDYGSAGTIGQGMIAGQNAYNQGSQNLLNFGGNMFGRFMGGMGGFGPQQMGNNYGSSYGNSGGTGGNMGGYY